VGCNSLTELNIFSLVASKTVWSFRH